MDEHKELWKTIQEKTSIQDDESSSRLAEMILDWGYRKHPVKDVPCFIPLDEKELFIFLIACGERNALVAKELSKAIVAKFGTVRELSVQEITSIIYDLFYKATSTPQMTILQPNEMAEKIAQAIHKAQGDKPAVPDVGGLVEALEVILATRELIDTPEYSFKYERENAFNNAEQQLAAFRTAQKGTK